jgi:hypothetical protein
LMSSRFVIIFKDVECQSYFFEWEEH